MRSRLSITCGWPRFFRADGTPVLHGDERTVAAEARAEALAARLRAAGLDPDGA